MRNHQIITDIISLPSKFFDKGDNSSYSLLKETGYFELHNLINEVNIYEALIQNPDCVSQWLSWSEDKRSTSGWYFKQDGDQKYTVGYFPAKIGLKTNEYFDVTEACAAYIKQEIEDIRLEEDGGKQ